MNRTLIPVAAVFGTSSLLLLDSAIKGGAILVIALLVALLLRRDSAATRHLVWLVAIVAMLVVPMFSALLPRWHVLPAWATIPSQEPAVEVPIRTTAITAPTRLEVPTPRGSVGSELASAVDHEPIAVAVVSQPPPIASEVPPKVTTQVASEPEAPPWNWLAALPLVWASGFGLLVLRLLAARLMLWISERGGTVIGRSSHPDRPCSEWEGGDTVVAAFESACRQLEIRQQVSLLLHAERTIPVVWGIHRFRLLLPTAARQWNDEQLRSVLLHELAHIKRRDTIVQLLAQIACALHWFDPLVWFAAWRLHVERERACDDLVLASGVRPSAYAEHLLQIATSLSPTRWTSACGLAMARNSSLDSRLRAVLSEKLNRRRVSAVIAAVALLLGSAIAIPMAMLRAAQEERPIQTQNEAAPRPDDPGQLPESSQASADEKNLGDPEVVFITRESSRPLPKLVDRDGVTLEISERIFHGADVITTAHLRWPAKDGVVMGNDISVAMDFFGNREPWAIGWVRGTEHFWQLNTGVNGQQQLFSRTSWDYAGQPEPIITDYLNLYPGEPIRGLGVPPALAAKFEEFLGITDPQEVDKSGGLPTVGGQFRKVAEPVQADGSIASQAAQPENRQQWTIRFVDGETGKPVPRVRAMLLIQKTDGSHSSHVTRIVTEDRPLQPTLDSDQFAYVICEDDTYLGGGTGILLGNIPENTRGVVKHSDPDKPLEVKVWRGERVAGRVLLPDGKPAAGVTVRVGVYLVSGEWKERLGMEDLVESWDHGQWPNWVRHVKTDENGDFSTVAPPRDACGYSQVSCDVEAAAPFAISLELMFKNLGVPNLSQQDKGNLLLQLKSGVLLHGRVLDINGIPIARAEVMLSNEHGLSAGPRALTDGQGSYQLRANSGATQVTIDTRPRNSLGTVISDEQRASFATQSISIPEGAKDFEQDFQESSETPTETPTEAAARDDDAANDDAANDGYKRIGLPLADLDPAITWGDEQNGLRLGMHIADDVQWRIGEQVKVELWVGNPGSQEVRFENIARNDVGLRVQMMDQDGMEHNGSIAMVRQGLFPKKTVLSPRYAVKVREFAVVLSPPAAQQRTLNPVFTLPPGEYEFRCEHQLMQTVITGTDGLPLEPKQDVWTGKLTSDSVHVEIAAADAPPESTSVQPPIEWAQVRIAKDGAVFLNRKPVSLAELSTEGARHPNWLVIIDADERVPYQSVVEVADELQAAGVTFSYRDGRMGDGKCRVANLQANYEFDPGRFFSICRPRERQQWFTVGWAAEIERPRTALRIFPNVSEQTRGRWAVAWEPGSDVLWWVDDTDVGKVRLTNPAEVLVTREGRENNFSRDFGLPDGVKDEFRRLGFVIGRDKTPGFESLIGGNTGGEQVLSAETAQHWLVKGRVTGVDGKPLANIPIRVRSQLRPTVDLKTAKTDEDGNYSVRFSLDLATLAAFRGVRVEPALAGMIDAELAESGEFNALLHASEKPQRPGDENAPYVGPESFAPGEIPRFAERDLVIDVPSEADFVLIPAGEISGEIVDQQGNPISGCGIAVAVEGQRKFNSVAVTSSDEQGRFLLKGVPFNKPLIFNANVSGRVGESSSSPPRKFGSASAHQIRIVVPTQGQKSDPLKIEPLDD